MSKIFRTLASLLFFLCPLYTPCYNYQVDYISGSKKYDGSACWKSYNEQIIFSGNITGAKNKTFSFISRDDMFIIETDGNTDTLLVDEGRSDLLEIIEAGRKAISRGINNWKGIYKIAAIGGENKIEMKIENRIIEIRSKNEQYLLKNNFVKELKAYVNPSTDDFITGWEIDGIALKYLGYIPLDKNGSPLFKF